MSSVENTKRLLASTLEDMMRSRNLHDIHVREICEAAGVTRQTFYYHFKDKYDLVAWIYLQDMLAASMETAENIGYDTKLITDVDAYEEQIRNALHLMKGRRAFYRNALKENEQNSLRESMWLSCVKSSFGELRRIIGTKSLSNELQDAVRCYYYGINGILIDWILGTLKREEEELIKYHVDFMPRIMSVAYAKGVDLGAQ